MLAALEPSPPAPVSVVHVGGGAGTLARWVAATRPGSIQVVAEADAALAAGVTERLGPVPYAVHVGDGRALLTSRAAGTVDAVVTDAFVGPHVPSALTTVEYFEQVARVLRPDGVAVLNVADSAPFAYLRRLVAAVRTVFPDVALLAEPGVLRGRRFGNVVVVGGATGELPVEVLARAAAGDAAAPARVVTGPSLADLVGDAEPLRDSDPVDSPPPPQGVFRIR